MDVTTALLALLLPPALLGVVLAMAHYEDRMLPAPPEEPDGAAGAAGEVVPVEPLVAPVVDPTAVVAPLAAEQPDAA
ncbi:MULTISPECIES: hypothetical protein [Streptomyces]|uniref:Uncharacterized protein n=2 Tax=Streptomyces TaxID=1883 RepID=A0A100YA60_9ACTN|nr:MULTISPECIES: hypothetical protein [Streptomyces]KUH40482.1 hypothetical protein ATE80_00890 [Streptomyces kanasensis]UUS33750.1 hypothetical protein NRO40_24925 [Streptomyces changanensis]